MDGLKKTCKQCGETKPLDGFYRSTSGKHGCQSKCKVCVLEQFKRRWQLPEVKEAARARTRTEGFRQKARERRKRLDFNKRQQYEIKAAFGISREDYLKMLEGQSGCCAICGATSPGRHSNGKNADMRFSIDHCHKTMKIRGLLCVKCNTGLGCFQDNPRVMTKAIKYLLTSDTGFLARGRIQKTRIRKKGRGAHESNKILRA